MKKQPIYSIYFIKAISALGIVAYHFALQMNNTDLSLLKHYANGSIGNVFVTVFFVVSGALLHYHYADHQKLGDYYIRRWRSIYPMFYLAYFYFFVIKTCNNRTPFYNGGAWKYLFTLLGMDGYLEPRISTYYIIGEWFLGAVVIMYLIYPLVRFALKKNRLAAFAGIFILYAAFYGKTITSFNAFWTVSSCLLSFGFGIAFMEYRKALTSKWSVGIALIGTVFFYLIKLPVSENVSDHVLGMLLFILLSVLGEGIMKQKVLRAVFKTLGNLSYPVFLVHHQVLIRFAGSWQPGSPWKAMVILAAATVVILCLAKVLALTTDAFMKQTDTILLQLRARRSAVK